MTVERMVERARDESIDKLAGIQARGFILAGAIAMELDATPIRLPTAQPLLCGWDARG
jgi:adenine/guanine phosphoribosyltransferase-like PRPP-binding protein